MLMTVLFIVRRQKPKKCGKDCMCNCARYGGLEWVEWLDHALNVQADLVATTMHFIWLLVTASRWEVGGGAKWVSQWGGGRIYSRGDGM
nr:hypothetical protein Iba_chr15aCG16800 [Ipomoea batatas]